VQLEDVAEAAHPGLPGEVEDAVDAAQVERVAREVEPEDLEAGGVVLLHGRVVVVVERVDPDDVVTALDERVREVRADEARGAGDEVALHKTATVDEDRVRGG
jgi:hypothetical protein